MSLKLKRTLSKSGGSLVLRIPKDVERGLSLKAGVDVYIWVENGQIVIESAAKQFK